MPSLKIKNGGVIIETKEMVWKWLNSLLDQQGIPLPNAFNNKPLINKFYKWGKIAFKKVLTKKHTVDCDYPISSWNVFLFLFQYVLFHLFFINSFEISNYV